jgi:serine/threonine protein kinase
MKSQSKRIREVFLAIHVLPPDQQDARLSEACGGDEDVRSRVLELLKGHRDAGSIHESPGLNMVATIDPQILEQPGSLIGPYKLLELIGEGGMGVVYHAEQQRPVRRRVALKLIKPGMDSKQVIGRFEAERQALAMMDHPNIAKVHDGGATPEGRPFFVMELVKGLPITEYCDKNRLGTRQRLELFLDVCHAVQHAHQKGIIHRDLKPSNVLVEIHDVRPVVKIIDFGISKAIGQQLTDKTLFTGVAQMVGTPMYMSPEQAGLSSLDVDTRSDVYSLGVLLYELLTGTTPFDSETLKKAGYDEMRRIVREDEPPKPSTRLSTLQNAALSTIAELRGLEPGRLTLAVRGELDWMVMRALEKDRDRRYESGSALAADVERYLADEPVEAGPPSTVYRVRKYVRRNRQALLTTGAIMVALVAATAVSTWKAFEADAARQLADRRLINEKEARNEAATEAAVASAVNDFLQQDLLRQANRASELSDELGAIQDLTVKEALDRAADKIGERFRDQPRVEAAIQLAIAQAYGSLHKPKLAVLHAEKAVALRRTSLGPDHPDTLYCSERLAEMYGALGRRQESIRLLEDAVDGYERRLGSYDPRTLEALHRLSYALSKEGIWDRSIVLAQQLVNRAAKLGSPHDANANRNLASCYVNAGFFEDAVAWSEKALKATRDPNSTGPLTTYGRALQEAGRLDEADVQFRKALEIAQKQSDRRARELLAALLKTRLGLNLLLQHRYKEAERVVREALAVFEELPDRLDNWGVFHTMSLVGGALLGQERFAEAEPYLVQGYDGMKHHEDIIGPEFRRWFIREGERLVSFYEATNQPEKARRLRQELGLSAGPKGQSASEKK